MPGYAESRAYFFSVVRSCHLAHEAGLPALSMAVVLNEATVRINADILRLGLDEAQTEALLAEVLDALRSIP